MSIARSLFDRPSVVRVAAKSRAVQVLLVATTAFAVYANTLSNGFVDDDESQVLQNPWIRDVRFIPDMFSKDVWGFVPGLMPSNYYRPLMHVIYLINYRLFGLQAWGFHLVNVLFHMANTVAVYFLAVRLLGSDERDRFQGFDSVVTLRFSVPLIAALLFATHPVHTEAVAWVASIPELSFTLLYLLSFTLYAAAGSKSASAHLASVALFFAGLLCKETALTLPALLFVYDLALGPSDRWMRKRLVGYVPYVLVAGVYVALRYRALSSTLVPATQLWHLSAYQSIINIPPLFAKYVEQLLVPVDFNWWHSFHPISSLLSREGALSLVVVIGLLAVIWQSWTRERVVLVCVSLCVISLAPAFYINAVRSKVYAERYLYLPSVGFVIVVALLVDRLARVKRMRILAVLIVVATIGLYSIGTIDRNSVWRDGYHLFADAVGKSPDAEIPRYGLARALFAQGRVGEALAHFAILVRTDPGNGHYQSALGDALLAEDRLDEAIEHLQRAVVLTPGLRESFNALGVALGRKGNAQAAVDQYRKALIIDPEYADAHFNLGGALAQMGKTDEATYHYRAAVRLNPDKAEFRNVLGIAYGKQELFAEAMEQFREAVRLVPSEPAYARNLERALALQQAERTASGAVQ